MTVTHDFLLSGRSNRKGWNRSQLNVLGVQWPPPSGWKDRVIGKNLSTDDANRFLALRGVAFKMSKKRRMKSELPLPHDMDDQKARTVDSFWIWLTRLEADDRQSLQSALVYIARKNASFCAIMAAEPKQVEAVTNPDDTAPW